MEVGEPDVLEKSDVKVNLTVPQLMDIQKEHNAQKKHKKLPNCNLAISPIFKSSEQLEVVTAAGNALYVRCDTRVLDEVSRGLMYI